MASGSWHLSEVEGWEVHKAASKACRRSWFFGWQFIISQKIHGILVSWKVLSNSNDDADVMLVAVALEGWVLASQDRRLFEQVPISPRICFWSSFRACKPMGHRQVIHNTWVNMGQLSCRKNLQRRSHFYSVRLRTGELMVWNRHWFRRKLCTEVLNYCKNGYIFILVSWSLIPCWDSLQFSNGLTLEPTQDPGFPSFASFFLRVQHTPWHTVGNCACNVS